MRSRVIEEVDWGEVAKAREDVAVFGDPPVLVLQNYENHMFVEMPGGQVQRDDPFVELVEHVAGVASCREHHRRRVVADVAAGRLVCWPEGELGYLGHDGGLPFARVRSDFYGRGPAGSAGAAEENGGGVGVGSDVSKHAADVGAECSEVA